MIDFYWHLRGDGRTTHKQTKQQTDIVINICNQPRGHLSANCKKRILSNWQFFLQSPLQELEVRPHSGPYLLSNTFQNTMNIPRKTVWIHTGKRLRPALGPFHPTMISDLFISTVISDFNKNIFFSYTDK